MISWAKVSLGRVFGSFIAVSLILGWVYFEGKKSDLLTKITAFTKRSGEADDTIVTHTKTTTKSPDGTVTVQNQTQTQKINVTEKTSDKLEGSQHSDNKLTKYSLGLNYDVLPNGPVAPDPTRPTVDAGVRLWSSPVWLDGEYDFKTNEVRAGVRLEF